MTSRPKFDFRRPLANAMGVLALVLASGTAANAQEETPVATPRFELSGTLDGARDRIRFDSLSVSINGTPATMDRQGGFSATLPFAPVYRVDIRGEAIFDSVQSFGHAELGDPQCQCLRIPAIELVARKKGRVELFFAGDAMAGRRYFDPPEGERTLLHRASLASDLDALFAPMKPYIETADLASVNLETVLSEGVPGPKLENKSITFFSPPELAHALRRAGFDYVTLGNNHIYDYVEAGVERTHAALEAAGLPHSGSGHNEAQALEAAQIDLPGNPLSLLGYVGWDVSRGAHQAATPDKGGAAFGTRPNIRHSVAREKAARRIPVPQYHGGSEYSDRPSETTIGRLREAVEQGAPIAIGHHPHVVQGAEVYRGSLIVTSLGNFMFDQQFPRTHVTYALKAYLENGKFLRAEFIPIAVMDYRPLPATGEMREAALRRLFGFSVERGTRLELSGGHAVIHRKPSRQNFSDRACLPPQALFLLATFAPVCAQQGDLQLGRDVLPRGDFELATAYGTWDRVFGADNAAVDYSGQTTHGQYALLRPEASDEPVAVYTQTYLRDVPAGEFTFEARIKLPRAARIEFMVKDRPQPGEEATARWRGELLGSQDLPASENWQQVSFDFARTEERNGNARRFRPVMRIVWQDEAGGPQPVAIDDVALVSWQPAGAPDPTMGWRWTHARERSASAAAE